MSVATPYLEKALDAIGGRGERRMLRPLALAPGGRLADGERLYLDFSSNDYLGLALHPLLKERAAEWADRHGTGAGGSRLVSGTNPIHLTLERRIAEFKGTEAALLFASGWQANAAVLPALLKAMPGALLFTDRLIHASLHQGASGARQIRFRHNDLGHLAELLENRSGAEGPRIIVTESVYSMDGDRVDLAALVALARSHRAFLFLDEAHATGVLGPGGAGLSAERPGEVDLVMGTFSKAFGGFGAYVAGSRLLCDYLVNACSGFIFTTAPPPPVLGALDAALDLVPAMHAERARLAAYADRVRAGLRSAGFDVGASSTQIIPAIVGGTEETLALSKRLERAGILASAIRPPTVPAGTSRIRLALRSSHGDEDIGTLIEAMGGARSGNPG